MQTGSKWTVLESKWSGSIILCLLFICMVMIICICFQDLRIAKTPFHALNMRERETFKERSHLLSVMGSLLRETAVQREQQNLERARQCTESLGHVKTSDSPPVFE